MKKKKQQKTKQKKNCNCYLQKQKQKKKKTCRQFIAVLRVLCQNDTGTTLSCVLFWYFSINFCPISKHIKLLYALFLNLKLGAQLDKLNDVSNKALAAGACLSHSETLTAM